MSHVLHPPSDLVEQRRERRIGTVSSAFAILRLLARAGIPLGITAIAQYLKLTPSSAFNIAKTMVAENWLLFDDREKTYQLGPGIIDVMRQSLDPERAFDLIRSRVEPIAKAWSITAGIWRVQGERLIAGGSVVSNNGMHIRINVGHRLPLLSGAAGRCVAAHADFSADQIARLFRKVRWECPLSFDQFIMEVELVRNRGWSLDVGNFVRGATTVAVPVFDDLGRIRSCLFGTMFSSQHPEEAYPALADELKAAASWASSRLAPTR